MHMSRRSGASCVHRQNSPELSPRPPFLRSQPSQDRPGVSCFDRPREAFGAYITIPADRFSCGDPLFLSRDSPVFPWSPKVFRRVPYIQFTRDITPVASPKLLPFHPGCPPLLELLHMRVYREDNPYPRHPQHLASPQVTLRYMIL